MSKKSPSPNDGIVLQKGVMAYAQRSFSMIQKLDGWGVHFQKDETGEYDMKKVHHLGTYVLPMPQGHNVEKDSVPPVAAPPRHS